MAEGEENKKPDPNIEQNSEECEDICLIEASVVSGFEECARGEAKEKFGCPVQSARGKIVWKVPIDRVKDVLKMGSIDNCRVVLHTVPHFKFTEDQFDDLSRLQKMVPDMDWDKGLRVWRKLYEFPYPIASSSTKELTPDDLVDVVLVERKQQKDPNARRNNKKGGRGKKKERKKNKKEDESESKSDSPPNSNQSKGGKLNDDSSTKSLIETQSVQSEHKGDGDGMGMQKGGNDESKECLKSDQDEEVANLQKKEISANKTVVIKRRDPSRPQPKIEVKVLIPGPNENAFPTNVDDKDRVEEPMDVDLSINMGNEHSNSTLPTDDSDSKTEKNIISIQTKTSENDNGEIGDNSSVNKKRDLPSDKKESDKITSEADDFATSVIEKLKTSSSSSVKDLSASLDQMTCTTPPSTPVVNITADPLHSPPSPLIVAAKEKHSSANEEELIVGESSVDPPSMSQSCQELMKISESVTATLSNDNEVKKSQVNISPEESVIKNIVKGSVDSPTKCDLMASLESTEKCTNDSPKKKGTEAKKHDPTKPTFRVTCNRIGECHSFDSSSAAASLGSAINTYFDWGVDLKKFNIEVLLNIDNNEVTVGIGLTRCSLHNRNLVAFGPTTLRATICYNMLRLARIKNGDIVCDPMCGTSALPIEGAINWVNSFHFGGDFHELAIERSLRNVNNLNEKFQQENRSTLKYGIVQWNLNQFPLRDKCVDVFVSDLPFGHRMGSRFTNRTLYPQLLSEMARTSRPGARACLLTEDKTSLIKAIQSFGRFWQRRVILSINMGGLSGYVFLLTRTTSCFSALTGSTTTSTQAAGTNSHTNSDATSITPSTSTSTTTTTSTATTTTTSTSMEEEKEKKPVDVTLIQQQQEPETKERPSENLVEVAVSNANDDNISTDSGAQCDGKNAA